MEAVQAPRELTCADVCALLSDFVDVRRGEIPHPDGTALARPGMRAAVEAHLSACANCRTELNEVEQINSVFGDYSVGELPAQHFADYGAKVRARIARTEVRPAPLPLRRRWTPFVLTFASSAAAALLLLVLVHKTIQPKPTELASTSKSRQTRILAQRTPSKMLVQLPGGAMRVGQEYIHDPGAPNLATQLQATEQRFGYFVFGEKPEGDDSHLLGVYLKTTRDVDHVVGDPAIGLMVANVVPGSPADRMRLRPNDYIVSIDGNKIENGGAEDAVKFLLQIREKGAGAPISLQIVRPSGNDHLFMVKNGTLGEYGDNSTGGVDDGLPVSTQF